VRAFHSLTLGDIILKRMFKQISIIIIIFFTLISCNESFEKLPEKYRSNKYLLKQIKPSSEIEYWQIDYVTFAYSTQTFFSSGNSSLKNKIPVPENQISGGFFGGGHFIFSYYIIMYIENDKWKYVIDEDGLTNFIGKIDNEYEAFLISKINNYSIDSTSNGNGFIKTDYGYKLKVMKYNSCPETKESFIVTVYENGKLKQIKNLGYYLQSGDCIVY